jgi:tryptophan synthase alpha chain
MSKIDILELGIPFSDPIADGPVFQEACKRSLDGGTCVADVFSLVNSLRGKGFAKPIVLTTYANIVYNFHPEKFIQQCADSTINGLIVPDLPFEESLALHSLAEAKGIDLISLVAPTTTPDRIELIVARSSGFIYLVSTTGVTGSSKASKKSSALNTTFKKLRESTPLPILVGFGISSANDLHNFPHCDGYIVGSALCRAYGQEGSAEEKMARVDMLLKSIYSVL